MSIFDRFLKGKTPVSSMHKEVKIDVAIDPVPQPYQEPELAEAWRAGFRAGAYKGMDAGVEALARSVNEQSDNVRIELQTLPSNQANDV